MSKYTVVLLPPASLFNPPNDCTVHVHAMTVKEAKLKAQEVVAFGIKAAPSEFTVIAVFEGLHLNLVGCS